MRNGAIIHPWHLELETAEYIVSHLTEEAPMLGIPKVVGVLSCAFMLCLGLSGTAALAADDMQLGKSGERIGGHPVTGVMKISCRA